MTISHMKAIEQYFLVVLYKSFKSVDENLMCGYPNKAIEQYYSLVQNLRSMNEIHFYDQLQYSTPSDRR